MLEKPDIPDESIISRVAAEYGLSVRRLTFLPLGADVNTAVYRVDAVNQVDAVNLVDADGTPYFLKLRKGDFAEISVTVPQFLFEEGIQAVIAPLKTGAGQLWAGLDDYRMILYPFIEGKNGYEVTLSQAQWREFGAALNRIHTARVPVALAARIPRETFSTQYREMVKSFQAQVEQVVYDDPVAARLAAFMRAKRAVIQQVVARADALGRALQARPHAMVLCHSDMHAGNLLIPPSSAASEPALFIVDWDNPTFAPKERDLVMIGGSSGWQNAQEEALFYQGYQSDESQVEIDAQALSYYRFERSIQDIAAFCQALLLTSAGGEDREQSYAYFTGSFLPGHEIDLALRKDAQLSEPPPTRFSP